MCVAANKYISQFQILLLILVVAPTLSWAEPKGRLVEPPLRVEMPPPVETGPSAKNVFQSWMPMPLDHFDPQNSNTFLMVGSCISRKKQICGAQTMLVKFVARRKGYIFV